MLSSGGVEVRFAVAGHEGATFVDSALGSVRLRRRPRFAERGPAAAAGSLLAPMPGTVVRVAAVEGVPVAAGAPLLWLEAMKMEHVVAAPAAGVLTSLHVKPGAQVAQGDLLAVITPVSQEG